MARPLRFLLPGRERFDRALPADQALSIIEEAVGCEIVDRCRYHPADTRRLWLELVGGRKLLGLIAGHQVGPKSLVLLRLQDVVGHDRFLDVSTSAEQVAGRSESLGNLGDDARGSQNRELRAQRREQVTGMALPPMVGMDRDLVDERPGRPLGADQDADRVGAREGDHAAAAPDLKIADRPLERFRRNGRLVRKVRRPAPIQGVDQQPDVVGAAEAIGAHGVNSQHTNSQLQTPPSRHNRRALGSSPLAVGSWKFEVGSWKLGLALFNLVEIAAPAVLARCPYPCLLYAHSS